MLKRTRQYIGILQAGTRLLCLLSKPYLLFLPLLILQFEAVILAVSISNYARTASVQC